MPCDRITTQTQAADMDGADKTLLLAALQSDGWHAHEREGNLYFTRGHGANMQTGTYKGGQLSVTGYQPDVNAIRRAYAQQVVARTAIRFGWQVKPASQTTGQLLRRY
jgi:hypothetical protein